MLPVSGSWSSATTQATAPRIPVSPVLGVLEGIGVNASGTISLSLDAVRPGASLDLALTSSGPDCAWFWSADYERASYRPTLVLLYR